MGWTPLRLLRVPTLSLERHSNLQSFGRKATNLLMSHHVSSRRTRMEEYTMDGFADVWLSEDLSMNHSTGYGLSHSEHCISSHVAYTPCGLFTEIQDPI